MPILNFHRLLFGVEETHSIVQKEYLDRMRKLDSIKPSVTKEKKNMDSKIKGLQNQLEQVCQRLLHLLIDIS